ncbi:hypothetical protein [Phytobacter sp. MRY16-398]|uniref:hypothetical protein n=1 Tax=Phytobacter sp. MRY16-398 TaxID=2487150 RepID=UPI000DF5EB23|nr:hypothetical protein [Phytobacter sp. MRY16-398]BBE79626.1 hypothetical protein MRY16398_46820 [Phytobacter sp. MRY16-398]
MAKYAIRYIGDNKTIEHHEEALRIAALSAAQAKFISTLLVCYPNQIENESMVTPVFATPILTISWLA